MSLVNNGLSPASVNRMANTCSQEKNIHQHMFVVTETEQSQLKNAAGEYLILTHASALYISAQVSPGRYSRYPYSSLMLCKWRQIVFITVLLIRKGISILGLFFHLHKNICCDPSLELTRQDGINEGSQHIFSTNTCDKKTVPHNLQTPLLLNLSSTQH